MYQPLVAKVASGATDSSHCKPLESSSRQVCCCHYRRPAQSNKSKQKPCQLMIALHNMTHPPAR